MDAMLVWQILSIAALMIGFFVAIILQIRRDVMKSVKDELKYFQAWSPPTTPTVQAMMDAGSSPTTPQKTKTSPHRYSSLRRKLCEDTASAVTGDSLETFSFPSMSSCCNHSAAADGMTDANNPATGAIGVNPEDLFDSAIKVHDQEHEEEPTTDVE